MPRITKAELTKSLEVLQSKVISQRTAMIDLRAIERKYNAVIKSKKTVETLVEANDSLQQRMREYHADRDNIRVLKDKNRQLDRNNSHLQSELDIVSVMKGNLASDLQALRATSKNSEEVAMVIIEGLKKSVKHLNRAIVY